MPDSRLQVYVASVQPTEELRTVLKQEAAAAAPPAKRARVDDGAASADAADASAAPAAMEMDVVQKVRGRKFWQCRIGVCPPRPGLRAGPCAIAVIIASFGGS